MDPDDLTVKEIQSMYDNGEHSDVVFIIGSPGCHGSCVQFRAHSRVLRTHESVFRTMFSSAWHADERNPQEILIPDLEERGFENLLRHEIKLTSFGTALNTLISADRYICCDLILKCLGYISSRLDADNALQTYDVLLSVFPGVLPSNGSHSPSAPSPKSVALPRTIVELTVSIMKRCLAAICEHARRLLADETFEEVSIGAVDSILRLDRLDCDEVAAYNALLGWAERNAKRCKLPPEKMRALVGDARFAVRFLTMTEEEFSSLRSKGLLLSEAEVSFLANSLRNGAPVVCVPESVSPFVGYLQRSRKKCAPFRRGRRKSSRRRKKKQHQAKERGDRPKRKTKEVVMEVVFMGLDALFG